MGGRGEGRGRGRGGVVLKRRAKSVLGAHHTYSHTTIK